MPRSAAETAAIEFCVEYLRRKTGEAPRPMPEGHGYDLEAGDLRVEVKGVTEEYPGFVYATEKSRPAAQEHPGFQMWIVTRPADAGARRLYVIPREAFLTTAKLTISWLIPLGKRRLEQYRVEPE